MFFRIGDAADTIKLLHIVNPDLGAIDKDIDDTECVKVSHLLLFR